VGSIIASAGDFHAPTVIVPEIIPMAPCSAAGVFARLKRWWAVLFLCAGSLLPAQDLSNITLYFAPASGGLPEEREFFNANMPGEIRGAHYRVVDSRDEADFLVSVSIAEKDEGDGSSSVTLGLITAPNNSLLLEFFWDYRDAKELYTWNIGTFLAPEAPSVADLTRETGIQRREAL
jgi:hypothetical protein